MTTIILEYVFRPQPSE
jgi:hypothetical protein